MWNYIPFEQAVEICDNLRKPINSKERAARIEGIPTEALYPYYGATGQVGYINNYLTDGEYVLLGEDGAPFLNPLAKKAYMISGKSWVNNHAHILRSKRDNKFLCYYLNYFNYKDYVSGTTRLKLTQAQMKQIKIPDISIEEQHRIVTRIEELFSELDKGVETLQTIKQQLAVYRQAVLKEAFEGILTKSPVEKFESLGNLIEKPRYGTSKKCDYEFEEHSTPVYRIPNICYRLGTINKEDIKFAKFTAAELHDLRLQNGDILIIRSNGSVSLVGRAAIVRESDIDGTFAGYLMRLRIKDSAKINPRYLLHYLSSHNARMYIENKAKSTSGVNNINSSEICGLNIPIVEYIEQLRIVDAIESRLSVCDSIEQTVDTALSQAEAMRQSILKKAFEGGFSE